MAPRRRSSPSPHQSPRTSRSCSQYFLNHRHPTSIMDITAQEPEDDHRGEQQQASPPPPLQIPEANSALAPEMMMCKPEALPEMGDSIIHKPEGNGCSSNHEWQAQKWDEKYREVKEYKETNGTCNVPQSFGALGRWVDRQRVSERFSGNQTMNTTSKLHHNNWTLRSFTARANYPRYALMPSTSWASSGRLKAGCPIGRTGSAS